MANKNVKQQAGLKPFYWVLIFIAVVGIGAIAFALVRGRAGNAAVEPIPVAGAENPQTLVAKAQGVALGPATAPVKMLVFSDFQCPYCGTFAAQIEPQLRNEFIEKGQLQLVYYDYPLYEIHPHSFLASRAARCAGEQGKFWEYHNLLFGRQSDWSFADNPPVAQMVNFSADVGLSRDNFESCVKSDRYQDVVSANRLLGERLGVNSTPTLIVNSKRVPANIGLRYTELSELIRAELGVAGGS